ncbi:MAG TPA: glycoside hydrolase family 15 protein [Myxococcales bacterium]|nr:glycoside hydrolase family 15 protein [Myxococcales bacterium]
MTAAIRDHAIVGDCRSAALVSRGGSLDWLCWPSFDSPSLFAALLDEERGGRFSISPAGSFRSERAYLHETNVLRTRFFTGGGELALTDFMPVSGSARAMRPGQELVRIACCERGEVEVEIAFDPRPGYGRRKPEIRSLGKLGLRVDAGSGDLLTLVTDAPLGPSGCARVRLGPGQRLHFSLGYTRGMPAILAPATAARSQAVLEETARLWRLWAARTRYDGPARDMVVRSALLLKLLQFAPSGAIIAAPTTSLPERLGGELNWDYRFCWLRDAALTARALFGLGHREEAESFMSWLLLATSLSLPRLHVLYDLYGRMPGPEKELGHLAGHSGSRPVRVGNAARGQVQLDTYGEVIEAATYFVRSGGEIDRPTATMLVGFGREVARDWSEPDEGIWEVRGPGSYFTHSRVLCWAALQRLCELAEKGHLPGAPAAEFARARDRIRAQVEELAWSEQLQSYTRTLAGADVDASLLLLPWFGYCPADAPRMRATWRRIRQRLEVRPGLFRRYFGGLTEGEGAFGICSFWAVEYLALGGGTAEEAEQSLRTLIGYANDVGLYGEEIEPRDGGALGNFPQAYTHVGLINAALSLRDRLEHGRQGAGQARSVPEARA